MTRLLLVFVGLPLLVLATVNCGDSPSALCTRFESTVTAKTSGCSDSSFKVDKAKCESSFSACSADDRSKVSTSIDCMGKVEACTPASGLAFLAAFGACAAQLENLSENCKAAFTVSN